MPTLTRKQRSFCTALSNICWFLVMGFYGFQALTWGRLRRERLDLRPTITPEEAKLVQSGLFGSLCVAVVFCLIMLTLHRLIHNEWMPGEWYFWISLYSIASSLIQQENIGRRILHSDQLAYDRFFSIEFDELADQAVVNLTSRKLFSFGVGDRSNALTLTIERPTIWESLRGETYDRRAQIAIGQLIEQWRATKSSAA